MAWVSDDDGDDDDDDDDPADDDDIVSTFLAQSWLPSISTVAVSVGLVTDWRRTAIPTRLLAVLPVPSVGAY
jgi:hypothetical protein